MRILQADFPFDWGSCTSRLAPAGHVLREAVLGIRGISRGGRDRTEVHLRAHELFTTHRVGDTEVPQTPSRQAFTFRSAAWIAPSGVACSLPLLETLLPRPSAVPFRTRRSGIGVGSGLISLPCDRCLGPSPVPVSNLRPKRPSFLFRFCLPESPKLLLPTRPPPLSIRVDDSLFGSSLAGLITSRTPSLTSLVDTKNRHKSQRPKKFQLSASTRNQHGL
jgi:hypothetical protein